MITWKLVLQRVWVRTLFRGATRLFAMDVDVASADAVREGPLFLFCRHASTLDTLLPAVFASDPRWLRLAHVMKRELLWDPCLDIVGQRTRNAFVRRGSTERDKELALLRQLAGATLSNDGVLLFPDGTRFSPAKRERALRHLADSGESARVVGAGRAIGDIARRSRAKPERHAAWATLTQPPALARATYREIVNGPCASPPSLPQSCSAIPGGTTYG